MLMRTQIRIMIAFVVLLLGIFGYFGYTILNKPVLIPKENTYIDTMGYTKSAKLAIFTFQWKKEIKPESAKNPNNYIVEQVFPGKKKWMTVMNKKKCKVDMIEHSKPKFIKKDSSGGGLAGAKGASTESAKKITKVLVYIDPREETDNYFRVRVKNLETVDGEVMDHVEYAVTQISEFSNLTKN